MAQARVQSEGSENKSVEVSHTEAADAPPESRTRRVTRSRAVPPAAGKRQRRAKTPEEAAEEEARAEFSRALITKYSGLVRQIAGGFQRKLPRNVLRDDLIAAGMSGLWDAVRKHGHEQTENFDWYVRVRIRGAILDELRAQDWLPRRARAAAAEAAQAAGKRPCTPVVLRFDDVSETEQARCLTAGEATNTEKTVEARLVKATLTRAMDQLPERERRIVSMHYFRGVKFKDLGEMLGVSEPRISQLHSRAMTRLKGILESAA
ncbi:MAG TPA: sigma-70 family RNA polymerase sigma factor [Polyangiaceae bacterium]|nr:sigma-70 family RNA polymerase sigma factor [Polyangiaceae bacterium]